MQRWLVVLLAVVAMGCLSGSAFAATYYVATWGNDTWPGTETEPWATLQHAVTSVASGDTIIVQEGTYVGCRITNVNSISGTPGAPCVLKAADGASVVINGPGPDNRQNSGIEVEGIDQVELTDWVVEGFEVINAERAGIDVRVGRRHEVRDNYCHDNGSMGIFLAFAYYPTIEYNECSYNAGSHGIYQSNSGDYPTIVGNVLHHNGKCGIHMNGDERYKPGDGLISYALIEDNVIYENGNVDRYAGTISFDGVTESIVRNNLVYENHNAGISLFGIDGTLGSRDNLIYNNTFVLANDAHHAVNITTGKKNKPNPVYNRLFNNIFYNANPAKASISTYDSAVEGFESDYNVVVDRFEVDENMITFAEWQALGYDLNSFISTPSELFVNPANDDYHLKVGSPAIDAGTTLAEVTDDIEGTSRPQGSAYDIGCYEAPSGPVPPIAEFSGSPLSGPPPLTVYFTDESSGSPTSWDWTFGDGGTSEAQHPSHEYTAVNSYTVSLTVVNAQGQDTETKPDYITVSDQSCHVGAIDMAPAGPPNYKASATITVHDQACQALPGVLVEITWSGAAPGSDSDVTDEYGQVTFTSDRNKAGGTFTCCVDNLTKEGYPYNSGANHETCDSITLP
jgi:parallel beta-helix repeat protein